MYTVLSGVPAVNQNGVVPCVPLYFLDPVNEAGDGKVIGTLAIPQPAGDMELSHRMTMTSLQKVGEVPYSLEDIFSDIDYNHIFSNAWSGCTEKGRI